MLPSRGAGSQRGTPSNRKPRGPSGRGTFGKRNSTPATSAAAKTDVQSTKTSLATPNGPKASAPFARGGGNASSKNSSIRPTANAFTPRSTSNLKSDDYNGRYTSLKRSRDQERKQAIADGFLADPDHPRSLANAITPVGTCQDMCAEFERVERVVQQDVWAPEKTPDKSGPDESRMVKKFRRAAAGLEEQLPSDLRPPQVLKRTIDFLINDVLRNAATLASVHYFIWDRTRAVRNDFSIQQVSKPEDLQIAIDCYERIARFHIMSLHQLSGPEKPYDNYDAQQEREQLDKTLLSILQYYDDNRRKVPLPNEAEFRSYSIIFQIQSQNPDLEDRMQTWPRELLTSVRIERALKLYTLVCNASDPQGPFRRWSNAHPIAQGNWAGFWALIKSREISYLMGCVAEIYFPHVRTMALNAILKAFKHGGKDRSGKLVTNEDWSLAEMRDVLGLEDEEAIESLLAQVGLDVGKRADGQRYFDLNTASGKSPLAPVLPTSAIVEQKRFRRTLTAIVNGMSVRAAHESGMTDEDEDEESLFLPQQPAQSLGSIAGSRGIDHNNSSQPSFGFPAPATNPFAVSAGPFTPAGISVPASTTSASAQSASTSAFQAPVESVKKTVHFSEDTKPVFQSPFASWNPNKTENGTTQASTPLFPSTSDSSETSTTISTAQSSPFPQAQTNQLFSNPSNNTVFPAQASGTDEQQSIADQESAKKLAAEKAAQEQRNAEEIANREREIKEQAARDEQEARQRKIREQEARMQAAKEKALQEKLARERATQERARQEAEARQAEEWRRREQERITREREREEQRALDVVSERLAFGDGGLFDQFVEFRLAPMIKQAIAQVEQEEKTREADWFRETILRHRYGRLWREICIKRRLQRRGAEKRKRAKRDAQLRTEHAKPTSIEAELEKFRLQSTENRERSESVASSQPSNKENDPDLTYRMSGDAHLSRRARASRRLASGVLPSPLNPSASRSSDLGASLLYNQSESSMLPPPRRNEDGFGRSTSTFSNSRGSSLNRSTGDIESIRSTYLPSASQTSELNGIHYGQKYDTTRSTYFKLRAMGLDPNSSTLLPERRLPQSDKKRLRTSDVDSMGIVPRKRAQTLNGGSRTSRSPSFNSPLVIDGNAMTSIEIGTSTGDALDAEGDDDPVIAMARRARAAMQEGSSLFREASRMLSSTPDRGATQRHHQRHQSHSALVNSPLQVQSGSPRPHRPAVSRFLNRIPKGDRQRYTEAAAQELAEEDAKEEARRKARANKELRDAEEAVERERLRQSQAVQTQASPSLKHDTASVAMPSTSFIRPREGPSKSPFTAFPKSPLDTSSTVTNEAYNSSVPLIPSDGHVTNGDKDVNPFASTIANASSTIPRQSSFGRTSTFASVGKDASTLQPTIAAFGQPNTATKSGMFGKPGFQAGTAANDPSPMRAQRSQGPFAATKHQSRPQPPVSRSANMFAALAGEEDESASDEELEDAEDDDDDDASKMQDMDGAESVGFSEEEEEEEGQDEDGDEELGEDEDDDDMPASDPTKWQGKSGTSVEDAIEL